MSDDELGKLAARSAELRRQIAEGSTEPAPPNDSTSWIGDVAPSLVAHFQAMQIAAEAHAAECTTRPCERCEKYVCPCGVDVDGAKRCPSCAASDLLGASMRPTLDSIPPRFAWAANTSITLLMTRVRAAQSWVAKGLTAPPSNNLLFTGETGTGKTSLAVAMLTAWVRAEPSKRSGARFVESAWLSRARARHRLGQDEAPLVAQCLAAPLLLLDDLGQEREDRDGCITDVVYGRSALDLPTWVTCGLAGGNLDSFAELLGRRYDGGFVRRILETGARVALGVR